MIKRVSRSKTMLFSVFVVTLLGTGCAGLDNVGVDEQTIIDRAGDQKVTDQLVVQLGNDVKKFMRLRLNEKRVTRKLSASIQVMTAAIAGALAAFNASTAVVASFAGVSAFIPELQEIFQAKEGAEAFRRGVQLIEKAEVKYLTVIKGDTTKPKLTPAGAAYYGRIVGALNLVEKALLNQIPTLEEVEAAEVTPP